MHCWIVIHFIPEFVFHLFSLFLKRLTFLIINTFLSKNEWTAVVGRKRDASQTPQLASQCFLGERVGWVSVDRLWKIIYWVYYEVLLCLIRHSLQLDILLLKKVKVSGAVCCAEMGRQ